MRESQLKLDMPTCGVLRDFEGNLQLWLVFSTKKLALSTALTHSCPRKVQKSVVPVIIQYIRTERELKYISNNF